MTDNGPPDQRNSVRITPLKRFGDWTFERKLQLGFGILVLVLALLGVFAYWQITKVGSYVDLLVDVKEPLQNAILEMEINVGETVQAVESHALSRIGDNRLRLDDSASDFERFAQVFVNSAATEDMRRSAQELREAYVQLYARGVTLIELADKRDERAAAFSHGRAETATLFQDLNEIHQGSNDVTLTEATRELLRMDTAVDRAVAVTAGILSGRTREKISELDVLEREFTAAKNRYLAENVPDEASRLVDRIAEAFRATIQTGREVAELTGDIQATLKDFRNRARRIDDLLDNEIQPVVDSEIVSAAAEGKDAAQSAGVYIVILAILGILAGSACGWLVSRSPIRSIERLVRQTKALSEGDAPPDPAVKTYDEFGVLSRSFSEMAVNLRDYRDRLQATERRFRTIFDHAPLGLAVLSRDGRIAHVNPAWPALFGYDYEASLGKDIVDLIDPVVGEETTDAVRRFFAGETSLTKRELRFVRADGSVFWGDTAVASLGGTNGSANEAVVLVSDITERKTAEHRLHRELKINSALSELYRPVASPSASIKEVTDAVLEQARAVTDSRYGYVSEIDPTDGANICHTLSQMMGDACTVTEHQTIVFVPNPDGTYKSLWGHALNSGEGFYTNSPQSHGASIGLPDGHVPIENFLSVPVRLGESIVGQIALAGSRRGYRESDLQAIERIAEYFAMAIHRVRSDAALQSTLDELARSNAELEEFAYVASHDLQEPLRMISSYVQLLERRYRGQLDDDADDFIHYAVDGAGRMQRLIADLLAYSRVGRHEKEDELIDCDTVLDQALANLRAVIESRQAVIERGPLPTVRGDKSLLTSVFQNLVDNALKFVEDDPPQVRIWADREAGRWIVSISDNGIGIDPRHADRIFAVFRRLHSRRDYAGSGIGLAMCKKIVERHRGEIWVESQPGRGSTFRFSLPTV